MPSPHHSGLNLGQGLFDVFALNALASPQYNQPYYPQPYYGQPYYGQPYYGQPYYQQPWPVAPPSVPNLVFDSLLGSMLWK